MEADGLKEIIASWAPIIIVAGIIIGIGKAILFSTAGNERQREMGHKGIVSIVVFVLVLIGLNVAFPGISKKLNEIKGDPCMILNFNCLK